MAAVSIYKNAKKLKTITVMKKYSQSGRGRYVSAQKVQQMFANLGLELCSGRKRIRAARSEKSIIIYANGGTVNISFNEKGGTK